MANHPNTIIQSDWFDKTKFIQNIPQPSSIAIDTPYFFSNRLPNIYIQVEPNIIFDNEDYLIQNFRRYHTIITFNKNVLDKCKNAKFYVYGTTWIEKSYYENIDTSKKCFKISTLAGAKIINNAAGHRLRQLIHHSQTELKDFPITFFRSFNQTPHITDYGNNPFLGGGNSSTTPHNKVPLFEEFQFAIIIENSQQINYFTEKIMDCLLTKTIPIYWGCPNISNFFDTSGWIVLQTATIEELKQKLSILHDKYYDSYRHVIEKNYNEALKYVDLYTNINNARR
jgi:hypothetical protein